MIISLIFQIIRRPGNLSDTEKGKRRAATQKKHYSSHKDKILERSKKRRELIADFVQRSQQLTVFAESALKQRRKVREKVEIYGRELERIYGKPEFFAIEAYVGPYKTPISYRSFTALLTYFLPSESLPNPFSAIGDPTGKAIDYMPSDTHHRQLSKFIHPDRNPQFAEYSALANAGWQLCKKVLADPRVKDMPPPPNRNNDPVGNERYCSQSDIHRDLALLFMAYIDAYLFVGKALTPSKLTPFSLCQSLLANVESRKLLNESLDDGDTGMRDLEDGIEDIIAQGKKFAALPQSRRKRNPRCDDELDEMEEDRDEDDDEDEDETEASSENPKKRPRNEMLNPTIDPTLLNQRLRPMAMSRRPRRG